MNQLPDLEQASILFLGLMAVMFALSPVLQLLENPFARLLVPGFRQAKQQTAKMSMDDRVRFSYLKSNLIFLCAFILVLLANEIIGQKIGLPSGGWAMAIIAAIVMWTVYRTRQGLMRLCLKHQ